MTVLCNNSAGFGGGPFLGRVPASAINGTASIRTGSWTLACRARWNGTSTTTDQYLVTVTNSANGRGLYLQRANGAGGTVVTGRRYDGSVTVNDAACTGAYGSTTAWNHICMTYDGTTIRTYLNGVASGTVGSATTLIAAANADSISIAGNSVAESCDVVVFTRALTAAEVLDLSRRRLPINRRGDVLGWWPEFSDATLANCGLDYSGRGNHCTLQASGSGNPASANGNPRIPWIGGRPRIIQPQGVVNNATSAGLSQTTGLAAPTASAPATGLSSSTGAAVPSASGSAAGLSQTTGTTAPRASAPASGLSSSSGAAANNLGTVAAGLSQTTGSAGGTPTGSTAAGLSASTGAASPAISAPAAGLSSSTGAASNNLSTNAAGLSQSSGQASAPGGGAATGLSQSTGLANVSQINATASGLSSSSGAAGPTAGASAAGLSSSTGAATNSASATASGLSQSTGAASGSSSGGGGGGGASGRQATNNRRFWKVSGRRQSRT